MELHKERNLAGGTVRGRWRSAFDQEGNARRELCRVGHRRRVGNKREREQGTPFLGQCTPASLTAHGEPQKDRWILGDFDAVGSAAPPCLSHLPPPSCRLATPDRSHGKLGRTLTLWSKPSLSGPAAWLEGVIQYMHILFPFCHLPTPQCFVF